MSGGVPPQTGGYPRMPGVGRAYPDAMRGVRGHPHPFTNVADPTATSNVIQQQQQQQTNFIPNVTMVGPAQPNRYVHRFQNSNTVIYYRWGTNNCFFFCHFAEDVRLHHTDRHPSVWTCKQRPLQEVPEWTLAWFHSNFSNSIVFVSSSSY